jgi:hypothetical protein
VHEIGDLLRRHADDVTRPVATTVKNERVTRRRRRMRPQPSNTGGRPKASFPMYS